MDARERRARWRTAGSIARGGGRRGLPLLPHDDELHRALPEGALADPLHLRIEARDDPRGPFGRGRSMSARGEARIWLAQRATAVVLALCVVVHLATIIYAV